MRSEPLGRMPEGYRQVADGIGEDGCIRVMQDVRGKYVCEGDYV